MQAAEINSNEQLQESCIETLKLQRVEELKLQKLQAIEEEKRFKEEEEERAYRKAAGLKPAPKLPSLKNKSKFSKRNQSTIVNPVDSVGQPPQHNFSISVGPLNEGSPNENTLLDIS